MTAIKIETLTVRLDPHVNKGLRTAAIQEPRSLGNRVERVAWDYNGRHEIAMTQWNRSRENTPNTAA